MKARTVQAVDTERLAPVRSLRVDGVRYRLAHQIGVGAFTTVYQAHDEWGNSLVVKVYPPNVRPGLWQNEARQLNRFCGPSVPWLHRVFQHEGHTYLVLDDGGVSASRCRFGTGAARTQAAAFMAQGLLQALGRLHAAQHAHGDVNPQNVLLRIDQNQKLQAVTLVDFALCRPQAQLDAQLLGGVEMAHWVPPPEYFRKARLLGSALDIWHTGVLLLQVLKGQTLDYSEADVLADRPLAEAHALEMPMAQALASALNPDPLARPDALTLWRSLRASL
jgi:serine/threonine protein kinase